MQFSVLNAWMFRGILQIQIALRCKFHVIKWYGSVDMVTQNYQCIQNHETRFTSRTHSSNDDGDVTMLDHVFINLNLCSIQWYKFRVCRGKGSRDTVTQIYPCDQNHEKWYISLAHSSISDGNVTILLHILMNFNLCCMQRFKSHGHRW